MYLDALSVYPGYFVFSILNEQVNQMQTITFLLGLTVALLLVGFFKSVGNTHFVRWDTRLFSPLGLFIGLVRILLALQ